MTAIQSKYIPDWVRPPPATHTQFVLEQVDASDCVVERRTFNQTAILFGRVDKVCDVLVTHVSASRVHACVGFDEAGQLQVGDLGSTHGMLSNRQIAVLPVCLSAPKEQCLYVQWQASCQSACNKKGQQQAPQLPTWH